MCVKVGAARAESRWRAMANNKLWPTSLKFNWVAQNTENFIENDERHLKYSDPLEVRQNKSVHLAKWIKKAYSA